MQYVMSNLKVQRQQKVYQNLDKNENKKWAIFTYHSPKIRKLTNLFKHTNINIAFKSTNTIQQYTKPKTRAKTLDKNQDYNMSGIHKLTCNTRKISYAGHTSRNLNQRYREHIRYIRKMTPSLPMHNLYYETYTNANLLEKVCPYSNPHIRCQL